MGMHLPSGKKFGELTLGGLNPTRYDSLELFPAYDYNGMWEMSLNALEYRDTVAQVFERKGVWVLQSPYMLIPYS